MRHHDVTFRLVVHFRIFVLYAMFRLVLLLMMLYDNATGSERASEDFGLCCLCDECFFPHQVAPQRGQLIVEKDGTTCEQLALKMAKPMLYQRHSGVCKKLQRTHRRRCCDPSDEPVAIATPTPEEAREKERRKYAKGTEPQCHLCPGNVFPGSPNTVTATLYVRGNPTCEELYYMGLNGLVPELVCKPIQHYGEEACGCRQSPDLMTTIPKDSGDEIDNVTKATSIRAHPV